MIFIVVSCLLMTSCQSVKYIDTVVVPNYNFPVFPAIKRTINDDGSWTIPKEDVDALAEFYTKYQLEIQVYKHDKVIVREEKNDFDNIY